MAHNVEVKTSYSDLYDIAISIHEVTGGAPVEVRDGTRAVKIGPWMPGARQIISELYPILRDYLDRRMVRPISGDLS